jgi:hypothetical protein
LLGKAGIARDVALDLRATYQFFHIAAAHLFERGAVSTPTSSAACSSRTAHAWRHR